MLAGKVEASGDINLEGSLRNMNWSIPHRRRASPQQNVTCGHSPRRSGVDNTRTQNSSCPFVSCPGTQRGTPMGSCCKETGLLHPSNADSKRSGFGAPASPSAEVPSRTRGAADPDKPIETLAYSIHQTLTPRSAPSSWRMNLLQIVPSSASSAPLFVSVLLSPLPYAPNTWCSSLSGICPLTSLQSTFPHVSL